MAKHAIQKSIARGDLVFLSATHPWEAGISILTVYDSSGKGSVKHTRNRSVIVNGKWAEGAWTIYISTGVD